MTPVAGKQKDDHLNNICKATLFVILLLAAYERGSATELYINAFRNPSIGMELKFKHVSFHAGYYTTIISKNSEGENVATGFIRIGETAWLTKHVYVSASYLYGLDRERKKKSGSIFESGVQAKLFSQVYFRLGVAVIPSKTFGTKVNPTPGLSFMVKL